MTSINYIFYQPTSYCVLAEGCLVKGMVKEGFDSIKTALSIVQQTKEKLCLSQIYRVQGDLFLMDAKPAEAEQSYHQAIIIAQQQSAKWFELLAVKSLARLWQSQGKKDEAYELLHGIYSWFTEGFDTKDMVEAKALLAELKTSN